MTDLHRTASVKIHGRHVNYGTELSIRGERGRFRFISLDTNPSTGESWLTCYGGDKDPGGKRSFRSFDISRVRTVHRSK